MLTKKQRLDSIYEYCNRYLAKSKEDKNFKGIGKTGMRWICSIANPKKYFEKSVIEEADYCINRDKEK